jgi:ABC-2 type transport system permease protein
MRKYFTVFKTSWANELEYRLAFFLARMRNIIYLLLLYYIWLSLSRMTGRFAMYSATELTTYVFGAHLLRAVIFGAQSRLMAWEINDGTFSIFLLKPVSHLWFVFWRELAQRFVYFISALGEITIFKFITRADFVLQTDWRLLLLWFAGVSGAVFLYFFLTYLVSLFAFWSREAMGPRFLFEWFLEFGSGAFFPLNILSGALFFSLQFLPFAYIIYFPMTIYLGRTNITDALVKIIIEIIWSAIIGLFIYFAWKKGLRRYSGEGI